MTKEQRLIKQQQDLLQKKSFDNTIKGKNITYLAGIDEVGRGPLAGPVVACAVVLPDDFSILGIDDSKKVSEKNRQRLCGEIIEKCLAYGIGVVDNEIIDDINILEATKCAMREAVLKADDMLVERFGRHIEHIALDAIKLENVDMPQTSVIKGDAQSLSIGAASIIAKVTRDNMMVEYDNVYPGYAFASNKGYGTKAHYEGISKLGITPIHRRSFLKNIL